MEKDIEVCLSDTDLRDIQSSIKYSKFVQVFHYKGEENAETEHEHEDRSQSQMPLFLRRVGNQRGGRDAVAG